MRIDPSRWVRTITRAWLLYGAALCVNSIAHAEELVEFSIPAQRLETALLAFADQTGAQMAASSAGIAALATKGVSGRMTPRSALERLIEGSDLEIHSVGDRSFSLVAPSAPSMLKVRAEGPRGVESAGSRAPTVPESKSTATTPPGTPSPERPEPKKKDERPNSTPESAAEKSSTGKLETVIVTAQKRQERLVDVPMSVAVVSAEDLAKQGVLQFRDYADRIPGLSYYTLGAGYTQVSLRGVTVGQDISPTVGIYLDDVPYGSSTAYAGGAWTALDVSLSSVERIEVLKGPQGTLYGSSTVGGLIKYVTRAPDTRRFGWEGRLGTATVRHGDFGYDAFLGVNIPLVEDKLALRVSGFDTHDGGYVDDVISGREDVNSSDIYGGRVDLLYRPTEKLSLRLNGFLQSTSREGMTQVDYTFTGTPVHGELLQRRLTDEPFYNRFRLASLTLTYDFGSVSLMSISSYQETAPFIAADISALYVPLLATFGRTYSSVRTDNYYDTDKVTQELRLVSAGAERLEWLLGAFYTRERSEVRSSLVLRDSVGLLAVNDVLDASIPSEFKEIAGFGNLTFHVTDRFDVSAGVRYAGYDQSFNQQASGRLIASTPSRRAEDDVYTYLATARLRLADATSTYVRYATGYRPGGVNFVSISPTTGLPVTGENYDSDDLNSYELGLKHEADDGRWAIDVSGYYIDWNDIQIFGRRNSVSVRTNAPGGATIKGAELAFSSHPVAGLSLSVSLNLQEARLKEADPDLRAAKDERLPNSPDQSGTLGADYTFPSASWNPSVGATIRYASRRTSGYDSGIGARRQYELPAYTMVDLRAGATVGRVRIQAYARNLFDKRAELSAYTTYGSPLVTIAQPRTVGLTASIDY
jgi:outer membrane receptor protein involved in Fe transport